MKICYLVKKVFFFISRKELNLFNLQSIKDFFLDKHFNGIINCTAYTSVEGAETDQISAEQINHIAVAKLAEIAKAQSIPLIHISTDYVFNGKVCEPYVETDETDPQNLYGVTKLRGERAIKLSGCKGAIIRTSWLYSEFGNNFVKTMLLLGKKKDKINVIIDQVGSPTYATNLAKLILIMLNNKNTKKTLNSELNIYHFSDEGNCTWLDFAKSIFQISDISCKVKPIATKNYPSVAYRPKYTVMNKNRIRNHISNLIIPEWRESLKTCLKELKKIEFY